MQQRKRDVSKYIKNGHTKSWTFAEALEKPVENGLNSIIVKKRWLDFRYEDRGSKVTLVTFSAALSPNFKTYPVFSAAPTAERLGVNYLGFADPAYGGEESLPTFWHLGTKRVDSQSLIPQIIRKVLTEGSGSDLLFFGSSAGGFAALNYSSKFPGSAVVAVNPRINLLNDPKRMPEYTSVAFPGEDRSAVARSLPYNLAKVYEKPHENHVVYVQNLQDDLYVSNHYSHFEKATRGRTDVTFVTGDWGVGHVVPPRHVYEDPLQRLVDAAPAWGSAVFSGSDFT